MCDASRVFVRACVLSCDTQDSSFQPTHFMLVWLVCVCMYVCVECIRPCVRMYVRVCLSCVVYHVQVTKTATRDGQHLEFDIPFDQLGFGGKPFKEVLRYTLTPAGTHQSQFLTTQIT